MSNRNEHRRWWLVGGAIVLIAIAAILYASFGGPDAVEDEERDDEIGTREDVDAVIFEERSPDVNPEVVADSVEEDAN